MKRIHKGDEVVVIAGRSKGQRGHVLRVMGDDQLLVENVNMVKKHQKPNPSLNQAGGIVEKESPIHVSNVSLCNKENQPVKVKVRFAADGAKELFYLEQGKEVKFRQVKKHS